ncbi:hypothetical protein ACHAW5_000474 [Stephanodiscus triporus]|uniref:Uncharacterized protein n=1 Tax=Stephanodiscus triporus TaxID=2934178 RepID=A0ABD3NAR3_9STRA
MFPNPRYDPSSRRRRHRHGPTARNSHYLTHIATVAVVAYGAYRLGSWAWRAVLHDDDDDDDDDDTGKEGGDVDDDGGGGDDGDLLHDWANCDNLLPSSRAAARRAVGRDIIEEEGSHSLGPPFTNYIGEVVVGGMGDVDALGAADGEAEFESPACGDNGHTIRRSRRSRVRWSGSGDQKDRSHRPSPPQDYQHHHQSKGKNYQKNIAGESNGRVCHENDGGGDGGGGIVKKGMKKAATMASTAIGGAVTAGISAGIHAYNQNFTMSINGRERYLRMGRCRLESSRAMMDFLPTLRGAIARETDVSRETAELRRLRARKKEISEMKQQSIGNEMNSEPDHQITPQGENDSDEDAILEKELCLWKSIMNKSITRLITTAYAHTAIFLTLNVQVNLLGGRLLREEQEEKEAMTGLQQSTSSSSSATAADRYRSSHQTVLSKTYHHLFAKGIPTMAEIVGEEVQHVLQNCDVLDDDVTLQDVSTWLQCVRDGIERGQRRDGTSALVRFVIPPQELGGDNRIDHDADSHDELARYILDETYDLLESPTFASAEHQCLDSTFDRLRTKVLGTLFVTKDRIPIVNIVTFMQKTAVSTFHKPPSHRDEMKNWEGVLGLLEEPLPSVPNDYISKLERLEAVQDLSNICF